MDLKKHFSILWATLQKASLKETDMLSLWLLTYFFVYFSLVLQPFIKTGTYSNDISIFNLYYNEKE